MPRTPHLLAIQSHVVFGHAGNAAAVFPMQRIGINVWPLNTVQFSNHTQYGRWTGQVLPPEQIPALVDGIAGIGELGNCDAVLSGYLGSAAQGRAILDVVARIKQANPRALYLCDPVMGHPEKGCIVAPEVSDFLLEEAAAVADYLCPNQLELDSFCDRQPNSLADCVEMARSLLARGPRAILVKHLNYPGKSGDTFEMLLVAADQAWHLQRPLLAFPRQPVGVGDLASGLFLSRLLLGDDLRNAFEFTGAAVHEVLLETQACGSYELELVRAQDRITPKGSFRRSAPLVSIPVGENHPQAAQRTYFPSINPPTTITAISTKAMPRRRSIRVFRRGPAQNSKAQVAAKRRLRATRLRPTNSQRSSWVTPLVMVITLYGSGVKPPPSSTISQPSSL